MKRLILTTVVLAATQTAGAQLCDADFLRVAGDHYAIGRVEETSRVLRPCLPDGFRARSDRVQAFRLLALASIATDSLDAARFYVRDLLRVDSRFKAGPDDPPMFHTIVRDIKPKWYTWLWTGRRWYHWTGRGLIVGAAVGLPLLLRNEPLPELPSHPGFPPSG